MHSQIDENGIPKVTETLRYQEGDYQYSKNKPTMTNTEKFKILRDVLYALEQFARMRKLDKLLNLKDDILE